MPPSQPISAGEFANPCPRGRCLARSWGSGLGRSLLILITRVLSRPQELQTTRTADTCTLRTGSPRPMACDHPKRGPRGCRASLDLLRTTHGLRRGEIWAASIGRRKWISVSRVLRGVCFVAERARDPREDFSDLEDARRAPHGFSSWRMPLRTEAL
jgi:hypothetical protein